MMKYDMELEVTPDGIILVPISVGTKNTCPPGKTCIGKIWGQNYCAVFGQPLERTKDSNGKYLSGRHIYNKCAKCIEANRDPPVETRPLLQKADRRTDMDIFAASE